MKVEILSWEFMMCFQLDEFSIGILDKIRGNIALDS